MAKESNRLLDKNMMKWIGYALTPEHAIESYFLFACYKEWLGRKMTKITFDLSVKILRDKNGDIFDPLNEVKGILASIVGNKGDQISKMLNFGEKVLMMNFRNEMIMGRDCWVDEVPTLLKRDTQHK